MRFQDLLVQKKLLVGAARFELATPCAQGRCATRLRYAPTILIINEPTQGFGGCFRLLRARPFLHPSLSQLCPAAECALFVEGSRHVDL
jgi:hypothetical protein